MLKNLYLAGLSTLLLTALVGLAYCAWLITDGDPAGLANVGKLLLLALYSSYRLRSILAGRYQFFRSWESPRTRNTKRMLQGAIMPCLVLLACAAMALAAGWSMATGPGMAALLALLAIFLVIEIINAFDKDPAATYE